METSDEIDDDPYNLSRFVRAQQPDYKQALFEIRQGRKTSHWMWYIFPQVAGLGTSQMSRRYSIMRLQEAKAYLDHPILGPRLVECAEAALQIEGRTARDLWLPGSHEVTLLRHIVRMRVPCGFGVRQTDREVLRRTKG